MYPPNPSHMRQKQDFEHEVATTYCRIRHTCGKSPASSGARLNLSDWMLPTSHERWKSRVFALSECAKNKNQITRYVRLCQLRQA